MRRLLVVTALVLLVAPNPALAGEVGVPDRALQKRIDKAIAAGAKLLESKQTQAGAIGIVTHRSEAQYEIGATALSGLALLAAGRTTEDDSVKKALKLCRKRDARRAQGGSRSIYDTATLLMFVVKAYENTASSAKRRKKKPNPKNPRDLPKDILAWVHEMGTWLAAAQNPDGHYGYPQNRSDLSNTQYALLGLRVARSAAAPIAPTVFMSIVNRTLALQEKDGPKVLRALPPNRPGGTIYKVDSGDRARGWSYLPGERVTSGSMTTAGVAVLTLCHEALVTPRRFPPYTKSLERTVAEGIQDGFAWLDKHWTLDRNPGAGAPNWHFYYLYGLERASVLAGRGLIGERDWYLLGAKMLVDDQKSDGRWSSGAFGGADYEASDILDTAWAILFLKRATRPAVPIQPPVVTGGSPAR